MRSGLPWQLALPERARGTHCWAGGFLPTVLTFFPGVFVSVAGAIFGCCDLWLLLTLSWGDIGGARDCFWYSVGGAS